MFTGCTADESFTSLISRSHKRGPPDLLADKSLINLVPVRDSRGYENIGNIVPKALPSEAP